MLGKIAKIEQSQSLLLQQASSVDELGGFTSDTFTSGTTLPVPRMMSAQVTCGCRPTRTVRTGLYRRAGKRIFDTVLILLSLPVVLPIVLILAALVTLNGGAPFYRQKRIGRHGRVFDIWKFRTMVRNADEVFEECLDKDPALRTEWQTKQKLLNDPRITRLGHFLRKSSIDELPQLFNVLRGDMSLVGPRPMMVDQQALYPGHEYYDLRPGITGFWQISERNQASFADRAFFDARYASQVSLGTDLMILFSTIRVVLRGTGH